LIKLLAHLSAFIPLAWLVYAAMTNKLGGDPQTKLMHELGSWALIFLLLCLSITPLKRLSGRTVFQKYRRMLGLYGAFYMFLHMLAYFVLYLQFDFNELFNEVFKRPYILVGMLALILTVPLVITSTKGAQRRLGRRWKKLHQLTYFVAMLGVIHLVWQSKSDLNEPFLYILWGVVLAVARVVYLKSKKAGLANS